MYVLGTGLSHDGSACLLKDGRISVAIEKERLTRRKHDGWNDNQAIQYCLDAEGIGFEDISLIVQSANFSMMKPGSNWWWGRRIVPADARVVSISHHLAHAYSAIGTSPFTEAAILIMDGVGSSFDDCLDVEKVKLGTRPERGFEHLYNEKDSYYRFENGELRPIFKDFSVWGTGKKGYPMHPNATLHSVGGLYLAASMYVFGGVEDAGKLMGLAPYGNPGTYDFEIFDLREGQAFLRFDWMDRFDKPAYDYADFKANFQYYADLAYWVQKEIERAVLYIVDSRYEMSPCENLVYAGGVALNAVANRRILKETRFKRLYAQPAAGDNGLAIGCAYYGWLEVLKRERVLHSGSTCFGKTYSDVAIERAISAQRQYLLAETDDDFIATTARLLAEGKVIGWFQGGSEFGPRALGHRSILADPRNPDIRDFINAKIKFREDFRPFAPAVIREEAATYFDCDYESPYMLLVAPVPDRWRDAIPGIIHRDGSARLQTVTDRSDPEFYRLLKEFQAITALPVLLNTSFNRRGMPIVETPEEAIDFFLNCALDAVVIGRYVIRKRP